MPAFFPIHEADTRCAVRWLRNHAAAYHIDASRIFSMGISAGAHLAVSLAVDSEIAAFDDGSCSTATSAKVSVPQNVLVDGSGHLYFAELYGQRIRKVDTAGIITTVAGNGAYGYSGDGGPATNAQQ